MKKLILIFTLLIFSLPAFAQRSVSVDVTGLLQNPLGFFEVNSNLLNAGISRLAISNVTAVRLRSILSFTNAGPTVLQSTLSVSTNATIDGTNITRWLNVIQSTLLNATVINGPLTNNSKFEQIGGAHFVGGFTNDGPGRFLAAVDISGTLTLNSGLTVAGPVTVAGLTTFNGKMINNDTATFNTNIFLPYLASVPTPGPNYGALYFKTDGHVYSKDAAGTEVDLTLAGSGGGENNTLSSVGLGWPLATSKSGVDLRTITITNDSSLTSVSNNNTLTFGRAALSGDVTASAGNNTLTIANGAVTDAKYTSVSALSVKGRAANSGGTMADIIAAANGQYLQRTNNALIFGVIPDVDLPASISRDTEWDTTTKINTATTDDDFLTLAGTQTITGAKTFTGAFIFTPVTNTLAWTMNVSTQVYQRNITATNGTVVFNGTAADGARFQYDVLNTSATNFDITVPTSKEVPGGLGTITAVTCVSNSVTRFFWHRVSGDWILSMDGKDAYKLSLGPSPAIDDVLSIVQVLPSIVVSNKAAGSASVSDVTFASSWDGQTSVAPSKNSVYDRLRLFDTDDNGKINSLDLAAAGFVAVNSSGTITASRTMAGTTFEISVANSDGSGGNPTHSFDRTATLAGNPGLAASAATWASTGIIFEGATANTSEGLVQAEDVTADRIWSFPDRSGLILVGDAPTATNATLVNFITNRASTITIASNIPGSLVIDFAVSDTFTNIVTTNEVVTINNAAIGNSKMFYFVNSGSSTLTWPASVSWVTPDGVAPLLSPNATDIYAITVEAGKTNGIVVYQSVAMSAMVTKLTNYTLLSSDSYKWFDNIAVTFQTTNTLPTAVRGYEFGFVCQDSDGLRITAPASTTIRNAGSVTTSGGFIVSTTVGSIIRVVAISGTEYYVIMSTGTWTYN